MKRCDITGCQGKVRAKGLCGKHYERRRRYGDAEHGPRATREEPRLRREWARFGPGGSWSTELEESDRLALVGL